MLLKKLYIPIGLCLVLLLAIGFLALRSDVVDEPIIIYKATTPIKPSVTPKVSEPQTIPAAMPIEETAVVHKEAEVPALSDEYAEFSRAELLERFPQYDIHSPESKENLHAILRGEKLAKAQRARIAELKRQLAEQEALETLASYLQSSGDRLDSEYSDVMAFRKTYKTPDIDDFIREYPDETERRAFMLRTLEAAKIQQAMADRILETPGAEEHLPSEFLAELIHLASIDIDEMIGGAE